MDGKGFLFVTTQIFQDFQKGGRGDSKERQEGGVGHQGRRDGEVGTTNFEVRVVQEDVKTWEKDKVDIENPLLGATLRSSVKHSATGGTLWADNFLQFLHFIYMKKTCQTHMHNDLQ